VYQRLLEKGIVCYSEPQVVELPKFGTMRAVVFEDPDGQLIELVQLPSADEIQRVRAASEPNGRSQSNDAWFQACARMTCGRRVRGNH